MTSKDKLEDPAEFERTVGVVCDVYKHAQELHQQGVNLVSCDEKTGIQALERLHPTLPTRPGLVERREFEYIRHGTLCLIANFFVASGEVRESTIGVTRTEEDFLQHIKQTVASEPDGQWIFVVDQLDTHMSASLVKFVVERCFENFDAEKLGKKGRSGILESRKSRRAFLQNPEHRIRFIYTPRHSSWLNQVEIWFSILARRVIKRGNFVSLDDLREKLTAFVDYFNATLAKPFRWTYTGRPLVA
jgi:hypothetical protein